MRRDAPSICGMFDAVAARLLSCRVMIVKKLGDELLEELSTIARYLIDVEDINVVVEPYVHRRLAQMGAVTNVFTFTPDQGRRLGDFIDFVVCMGGDGVILHTSQLFRSHVPPIVAFHLGSLGFLSQHRFESVTEDLKNVIYGRCEPSACKMPDGSASIGVNVSLRMRLVCEIVRAGKTFVDQHYEV
jgi:NAD+ kinase